MNLINTTGITKPIVKLGNAIVMTVAPVANLLEMANTSSLAWTEAHALDVVAKADRENQVRSSTHSKLLRQALADAEKATIEVNVYEREVQELAVQDAHEARIHQARMVRLANIPQEEIERLSHKASVTGRDITRTAEANHVALAAKPVEVNTTFDISQFQSK